MKEQQKIYKLLGIDYDSLEECLMGECKICKLFANLKKQVSK